MRAPVELCHRVGGLLPYKLNELTGAKEDAESSIMRVCDEAETGNCASPFQPYLDPTNLHTGSIAFLTVLLFEYFTCYDDPSCK